MIDALLGDLPDDPDLEVLLVDDGSTLPYDPAPRPGLSIRRLALPEDLCGPGAARNLGIARARGQWLAFADSDDRLDAAGLSDLLDGLRSGRWAEADMIIVRATSFRDRPGDAGGQRHVFVNSKIDRIQANGTPDLILHVPACWIRVLRRSHVLGHDIRFSLASLAEDVDFATELALSRPRTAFANLTLPQVREGHDSVTSAPSAPALRGAMEVKRAANQRLRSAGRADLQYPLLLDLLVLCRIDPAKGLYSCLQAIARRDRLLPPIRDLWAALARRVAARTAGFKGR